MKKHLIGLLVGFAIALIDFAIYFFEGRTIFWPMILLGLVFWTAVGWVVHVVDMPVHSMIKGVLIALFLYLPWLIEIIFVLKLEEQGVAELVGLCIFFGLLMGYLSQFIKNKFSHS